MEVINIYPDITTDDDLCVLAMTIQRILNAEPLKTTDNMDIIDIVQ